MTTKQLEQLFNLRKENALRILNDMKVEKLIQNRREEEYVWYLAKQGLKWLEIEKPVKFIKGNIDHYIIRNQVYIHFNPDTWKTEIPLQWTNSKRDIIIPDAIFTINSTHYFLEVDVKQDMRTNSDKIKKYRALMKSNIMQTKYGQFPTILFVTISEYRKKELKNFLKGIPHEILTYQDIR